MVVPIIAIPLTVFAGLTAIAVMYGAVLISANIRDTVIGESTPVELAESDRINQILNDPTLSYEEKMELIEAIMDEETLESLANKLLLIVVVIGIAYVAATYMKGK